MCEVGEAPKRIVVRVAGEAKPFVMAIHSDATLETGDELFCARDGKLITLRVQLQQQAQAQEQAQVAAPAAPAAAPVEVGAVAGGSEEEEEDDADLHVPGMTDEEEGGEEEDGGEEEEEGGEPKKLDPPSGKDLHPEIGIPMEVYEQRMAALKRRRKRRLAQLAALGDDEDAIQEQKQTWARKQREGRQKAARATDRIIYEAQKKLEAEATKFEIKEGLTDEQLVVRCDVLKESVTSSSFQYVNRGLFEQDKLTIATQLTLKIMVDSGELEPEIARMLIMGDIATDAGNCGPLAEWLPTHIWPRVKALESVKPTFAKIGDDMQADSDEWRSWFDHEKPETQPAPGDYRDLESIHMLLLLRAMRPDRVTAALRSYIVENLGEEYVLQKPFDMAATYAESSPAVPIFFVLFPGVDPTVWVEKLGNELGMTTEAGKFVNISMGQGQEQNATETLEKFSKEGGWVFFQNVHLMQDWLPRLERQLEIAAAGAHPQFRCFISAEPPPPIQGMKNMPESLMQTCIKVANEAPADLKSNLMRAWAQFSEERVQQSSRPVEFKACLFTLCWYHAIVLGRRRFGQQGWSKRYSFNDGDLNVCADVLQQYLDDADDDIPWEDLRYIFAEIMYGGHITDALDRRTNSTYLDVFLEPKILHGGELAPGFKSPDPQALDYDAISRYIVEQLPKESPPMFGLHPNAEIGYLTASADSLFRTILSLSGGATGASSGGDDEDGGSGGGSGGGVRGVLDDLLASLPADFVMIDINARAEPLLSEETAPYVLVAIQECTRMNALLGEMRRSLIELRKGLDGQLNMSESMEHLAAALAINEVPGRNPLSKASWEALAWPSQKRLQTWFADLLDRVHQLSVWSTDLLAPKSCWISGLSNPMAFLTAISQVTARQTGLPLDKMAIETHVTTMISEEEVEDYPQEGMFCHGLYIEGARWATGPEGGDVQVVSGVNTQGHLADSRLKELMPSLPVVFVRAVQVQDEWDPQSIGYIRGDPAIFEAGVYTTSFRGPTFVFLATLKTVDPKSKWVRAGVAVVLQSD